jgi:hypothetical protein
VQLRGSRHCSGGKEQYGAAQYKNTVDTDPYRSRRGVLQRLRLQVVALMAKLWCIRAHQEARADGKRALALVRSGVSRVTALEDIAASVCNRDEHETAVDRGCVKTRRRPVSRNIDLSERAVFDYFRVGRGERTPENEMSVCFHTASTRSRRSTFWGAVIRRNCGLADPAL